MEFAFESRYFRRRRSHAGGNISLLDILSALKGTEIPYRAVRLAFSGLPDGLLDGFLLLT